MTPLRTLLLLAILFLLLGTGGGLEASFQDEATSTDNDFQAADQFEPVGWVPAPDGLVPGGPAEPWSASDRLSSPPPASHPPAQEAVF